MKNKEEEEEEEKNKRKEKQKKVTITEEEKNLIPPPHTTSPLPQPNLTSALRTYTRPIPSHQINPNPNTTIQQPLNQPAHEKRKKKILFSQKPGFFFGAGKDVIFRQEGGFEAWGRGDGMGWNGMDGLYERAGGGGIYYLVTYPEVKAVILPPSLPLSSLPH